MLLLVSCAQAGPALKQAGRQTLLSSAGSAFKGYCGKNSTDRLVKSDDEACKSFFHTELAPKSLAGCALRCLKCGGCRYAIFSHTMRDCSLYEECDVGHLAQGHGYQTRDVQGLTESTLARTRPLQSHISNAAIHVTCDATSGFAELALPVADLIQLQELQLSLGDGRVEWLHRMTADIRGTTSVRFQSKQHVIKIGRNDHHLTRREACVVRKLAGGPGIPRLVGASHNDTLLVFANAGTPLGLSNMPSDYREQVEATLEHLAAHRVKHNDIWKNDKRMENQFIVELLVGGDGHLTLIDYNTATVNGSYACAPSIRATALPPNIDRYFTPADDATTLQVRARAHRHAQSGLGGVVLRIPVPLCRDSSPL